MRRILIGFVLALLLASCGSETRGAGDAPKPDTKTTQTNVGKPSGFWHGEVDGIECIAISNESTYNSGFNGITCNWDGRGKKG